MKDYIRKITKITDTEIHSVIWSIQPARSAVSNSPFTAEEQEGYHHLLVRELKRGYYDDEILIFDLKP